MRCERCQMDNPAGAKFCVECAAPLAPALCERCRSQLPPGAKFCPECAYPTSAQPAAERRFGSPAQYTPKHIAEKILESRDALEGERKHVSVLFADLKGSMELVADRDPEDARQLLDAVVERMIEAVHHYEGTVNQVMGDGIMALFGAPLAHEDHAVRACYAALRMQHKVKEYAEELHRRLGIPVHIRVGLNSGEVVVRSIGSDLHMDYTAVGQTTHLAARLEQMAMPGSILAPADTLALAEGYVLTRTLGPRPVRGLDKLLEVYEIVGASPVRSRLHAAAARGLTRFVGRGSELHQLALVRDRARGGSGQMVAVVGEPGVGKSRLYWEFTRSHLTDGWLLLESTSVSYGRATPYLPVIDLLRAYFKVAESDDDRLVQEKVTGKLLTLDENLRAALPPILSLLGVAVSDSGWDALGAIERRQRIRDAIKHVLVRESQVQPVAVLFEDLHWIDSETQALLDSLVDSLPTARVLLLVNYRPEYQHAWGSKSYYAQLRIDPLGGESATALLDGLLGAGRVLEPLKRLLRERTEGNPFFLEESIRTLVEAEVITGERGAFQLAKPLDAVQVPATVQAVLAARIDRLPAAVKHLLQFAAVIGKTIPLTLLECVAETARLDLRPGLAQLQSAEFLYELTLFPEVEYTFKHALTLEVAYQSLLRERRRVLHAAVLAAVEMRDRAHMTENIELLAHHAVRGEVWASAASYLYRAGAKAQAEARYSAAAAFYEGCVDALDRLGNAADRGLQLDAYLDLWSTRISTGRVEGLGTLGDRVEALARALDDGPRLAQVQVRQAQAVAFAAAIPGSLSDAAERAREAARRADAADLRTRSYAHFIAGLACRDMGRLTEALGEFDVGARLFESPGRAHEPGLVYPILVSLRAWRAEAAAALGQFETALASANEALRIAGELRHPSSLVIASGFLGYVNIVRGDLSAAEAQLERGLAIAEEHDLPHGICANSLYLAWALLLSGQDDRGFDSREGGLGPRPGAEPQWTRYGSVTAAAYLAAQRPHDARRVIEAGLTSVNDRGARAYLGPLMRLEAEVLLAEGMVDRAHVRAEEAFVVVQELAAPPEIARCHETLGRIAAYAGDPRELEHATAARRMFEDLGMPYWAARVTSTH